MLSVSAPATSASGKRRLKIETPIIEQKAVVQIICFTDPYCTWCWGSEPILGKIKEVYENQVTISYRMGGLVEDITTFADPGNAIGGENWYRQVADHWVEASSRHGMPVDEQVFFDIKDDFRSTYPASIAFKAAQLQGEELGNRYLRALRVAASAERKAIHRLDVQVELANEIGLELNRFQDDIKSGTAESAFHEDLHECRAKGARGFPSYLIRNSKGREIMLRGYTSFKAFETWLNELAGAELIKKESALELTQVHDFISRNGKVAPKEISEVFNVTLEEANQFLKNLAEKEILKEDKTGNGYLYSISNSSSECDPVSGSCC
ncbi:MAG: DsbA family protein [Nitrospinota bacterium]